MLDRLLRHGGGRRSGPRPLWSVCSATPGTRRDRGSRAAAGRARPRPGPRWTSGSGSGSGCSRSACCWRVLPFVTAPGRIIADTKLDLAHQPGRLPGPGAAPVGPAAVRPAAESGGRLPVPDGPVLLRSASSPACSPGSSSGCGSARSLCAAFLGVVRLAGRLGIGTPWTRIAAGCAYALSPAALTLIGGLSAEFLPAAMLPWILIPLVGRDPGRRAGGRRRGPVRRSPSACAAGSTRPRPLAVLHRPRCSTC